MGGLSLSRTARCHEPVRHEPVREGNPYRPDMGAALEWYGD